MKTDLIYSHYFLSAYDPIMYVLIYVFSFPLLWLGRWKFEGKGYDIAFSSKFGDAALTAFIILVAYIMRQPDFNPTPWMESKLFHFATIGISITSAIIYFFTAKPKRVMDIWHAVFLFPVFMYLIATTIPIFLCYSFNVSIEFFPGLIFLFVWAVCIAYDIIEGRMNQREWITKNRPNWRFKN